MKSRLVLVVGSLILGLCAMTVAQEQPAEEQSEVRSSVARISLVHGDVSTQRGDSGDWATVVLNQPIVSSDKVSTGANSRAEVQLDHGNILRLGDNTLAGVAGLSRNQIQIQVDRGLIDYSVFKGSEAAVEIDTANVAIRPDQRDGVYRIEVNPEGETSVIVRKGSTQISTPQGSTQVEQGQMAIVRGVGDDTQYKLEAAPARDSWDSWNIDRDHTILNAESWRNTNRYYVGSEDLDAYGRWVTVPDYGPVWAPVAGPGWAPYRSGRWVWEPGWGWTWVSYEPWGWAPYHYGRWFVYNNSWVWWPGPAYGYPGYRPVWAPAYVSFFGFGGGVGVGVGFGFGSVGWLPIGPCDTFYPWYGRYHSHYSVVNVTNINVYNNRGFGGIAPLRRGGAYSNLRLATMNTRVREGISTVPAGHFGTGRSAAVAVNGEVFRSGRRIEGNLPLVPTRAALSVSNRPAAASTIPRGGEQQRFFSKSRPAAAPRSFDNEVSRMRQSIQRSGAENAFARGSGPNPNSANSTGHGSVARPAPGVRTSSSGMQQSEHGASSRDNQGFQRFGSGPAQTRSQGQNVQAQGGARGTMSAPAGNGGMARPSTSDGSGWRKFSGPAPTQHPGGMNRPAERTSPGTMSNVPRLGNSPRPEASTNGGDWRHFTPQSGGSPDRMNNGGGMNGARGMDSPTRYEMSRPQMESVGGRGMAQPASRGYSRPPLEMRQPIVTPRGGEGGGPRMSAPSHGGGGGGGGGNRGGSGGGGSHGGGPHGGGGHR